MAIRNSKEDTLLIEGTPEENLLKVEQAFIKGGFTKVKVNAVFNSATGNYKKFTVYGELSVSLLPKNGGTAVIMKATANTDNIFALFSSPVKKILDQFRNNL